MSQPLPPYGTAIHQAIATGELSKMKQAAKEAEKYLSETGNLSAALAILKAEIAKAEKV